MTLSWRMVFKINNTLPEEVVVKIVPPQAVKYISLIRRDTGINRNTNMKSSCTDKGLLQLNYLISLAIVEAYTFHDSRSMTACILRLGKVFSFLSAAMRWNLPSVKQGVFTCFLWLVCERKSPSQQIFLKFGSTWFNSSYSAVITYLESGSVAISRNWSLWNSLPNPIQKIVTPMSRSFFEGPCASSYFSN